MNDELSGCEILEYICKQQKERRMYKTIKEEDKNTSSNCLC